VHDRNRNARIDVRGHGTLRNSNSVCLNGRPFKRDLESQVGREIRMSNDANCFAVSEAQDGAPRARASCSAQSSERGSAEVSSIDGTALDGRNGIAGEWGHNALPWPRDDERPGAACYCGRRGCIETFLSGPGFEHNHLARTGRDVPTADIVAQAGAGDAQAQDSLARYEDRLARALAHVINLLDPDVIVLGGGMSNTAQLYASVPKLWGAWIFSDRVDTKLVRNAHGDSSGVRGAARLWGAT
jgi:predicted NBD/HSP70 family sugar kinase